MTETFALSRPISVTDVAPDGQTVAFEADAEEREALAAAFNLSSIESLAADFEVKPWRGDGLSVAGTVTAVVVQPCVVSLAPVRQTISEELYLRFMPETKVRKGNGEIDIDPGGEDPPELFDGESLDLGAIAAEHVALGIDPYPRVPGAQFDPVEEGDEEEDEEPSPFAVLERLKRGGGQ
ncbi:DUF177 domain-containing protein [Amorphus orientalis]|uniref:Uncharacterized metal-binding protein YceD (DUF177 family) n=1 Tax=Amorphus orientalis TaxID=649198 RepID=A0AAE3VPR2_9HYPH|nr:DUF177 domain-containing protein [Amorphus orientalis]MDQ0316039.1 uncharacterized metal-binding protein YceD (DUF177 family) [Amorphus orientalis]